MKHVGYAVRMAALVLPIAGVLILGDAGEGKASKAPDGSTRVVAKVGDGVITVGELERRLGAVPAFQLRVYGATPEEVKRNFLTKVLIPELLFAQGAKDRGMHEDPEIRSKQRDLLKTSLLLKLRHESTPDTGVKPEEIVAYYQANLDRYRTPARVSVWRILVADRNLAQKLIVEARKAPTPKAWVELSQKHSLDKATSLRGGNLGFLMENGTSADGKTRVAPELAKAAFAVRDGEIVGEPVPEGSGFAVVWRRGSMPAVNRSLAEEAKSIEKILLRDRTRAGQDTLIARLRKEQVRLVMPEGPELIAVSGGGEIEQESKPGRIVRRPGRTGPLPTPRGLR